MACRDCLIWVGEEYYPTVGSFLREAEQRGCCRKVSNWCSWMVPGKTRVFLAHRGGHKTPTRGVIFGYYVLHGVDVVSTQQDCDRYKQLLARFGKMPGGGSNRRALRNFWKTAEGRARIEPVLDFWRKRYPKSGLPCHIPPPPSKRKQGPPENRRDELDDAVIDLLLDYLISCEPGVNPAGHGGYGLPTAWTMLEPSRLCGMRDKPETPGERPSVYLVDRIARKIAEEFCAALKEYLKKALTREPPPDHVKGKRARSAPVTRAQIATMVRQFARENPFQSPALPLFEATKERVLKLPALGMRVPRALQRSARSLGAMVVFEEPYPCYQLVPRASFMGFKRMDGDELLRRIRAAYRNRKPRRVTLPVCAE